MAPREEPRPARAQEDPPQPGLPTCGVLVILGAILRDAAADLARIEPQMAAARGDAAVLRHGAVAIAVLDRAARLLQVQRETILDQLTEAVLDAAELEGARPRGRDPGRVLPLELARRP